MFSGQFTDLQILCIQLYTNLHNFIPGSSPLRLSLCFSIRQKTIHVSDYSLNPDARVLLSSIVTKKKTRKFVKVSQQLFGWKSRVFSLVGPNRKIYGSRYVRPWVTKCILFTELVMKSSLIFTNVRCACAFKYNFKRWILRTTK